jgi:hypothetical protein
VGVGGLGRKKGVFWRLRVWQAAQLGDLCASSSNMSGSVRRTHLGLEGAHLAELSCVPLRMHEYQSHCRVHCGVYKHVCRLCCMWWVLGDMGTVALHVSCYTSECRLKGWLA